MPNDDKQLDYTISLEAPLLMTGSVGDENISLSEDYLSGSALLGMFAALYLDGYRGRDAHQNAQYPYFYDWFLSGKLQFLNGYKLHGDATQTWPVPLSIHYPKSEPGTPLDIFFTDSTHGEETKPYPPGYCILQNDMLECVKVSRQYYFHHKRTDQIIGRSKESEIFNYEAIDQHEVFKAAILGEEKALAAFRQWLQEKWDPLCQIRARLGRSKRTQYGKVLLRFANDADADNMWYNRSKPVDQSGEFTVTLLSHAILLNENGQAEVKPSLIAEYITRRLHEREKGLRNHNINIQNGVVRKVDIENYVSVWRARRPAVPAFQKGSCLLLKLEPPLAQAQRSVLQKTLDELENKGIGSRRHEGFGRIAINWQDKPAEALADVTEMKREEREDELFTKPAADNTSPRLFKTIFQHIAADILMDKVRALAAVRVQAYDELPSGTQIGRLKQFVFNAENPAILRDEYLKKLRENTKKGLEKFHDNQQTLLEHLHTADFSKETDEPRLTLEEDLSDQERKVFEEAGFSLNDQKLQNKLHKTYLLTFLTLMEKQIKTQKSLQLEKQRKVDEADKSDV